MYNVVNTLAPLFSIESSSFLQERRTTIKSGLCRNLCRPCAAKLAVLYHLKKKLPLDLQWGKSCEHSCTFIFAWILFTLAGNNSMYISLDKFEFQPDLTTDYLLLSVLNVNV